MMKHISEFLPTENEYLIRNDKTKEEYKKNFLSEAEARHWIINHLDLSLNWSIIEVLPF